MIDKNLPYSNGAKSYRGHVATIETNGSYTLPWSTVLSDGRRLADHGSYNTAYAFFKREGLVSR